jgi:hypothetical protein
MQALARVLALQHATQEIIANADHLFPMADEAA